MKKALKNLKAEMVELEKEWDRLDSMGNMTERQQEIARKMFELSGAISWAEDYLKWKDGK